MKATWKSGLGISAKSIVLLLVGLAAVAAAYLLVIVPMESQVGTDRERVTSAEQQAQTTADRLSRIEAAGPQAIANLEGKLVQSQALLPARVDPVALVNILVPAARNYQVDLQLTYSGGAVLPAAGSTYPVTVEGVASGSQQAITSWLVSLQQSRPLITISAVSVSSLDGQAVANVVLTVWGFGEATPEPAPTTAPAPVPVPTMPAPVPTVPVPAPTMPAPAPTVPVPAPTMPAPAPTGSLAPVPVVTPTTPGP